MGDKDAALAAFTLSKSTQKVMDNLHTAFVVVGREADRDATLLAAKQHVALLARYLNSIRNYDLELGDSPRGGE